MKKMIYVILMTAFVFIMAIGFGACAKKTEGPKPMENLMNAEFEGAPDWITGDCGSYSKEKLKQVSICAVGSMKGTSNPSLARTAAIARGRTEIAKQLETKVVNIYKDYLNVTGQNDQKIDEQLVQDTSRQITNQALSGTKAIAFWISKPGTYYALVVMDVESFKKSISQMKNLSESVRKAVVERADKAFGELDEEVDKERTQ